jgi:hypothetical protein
MDVMISLINICGQGARGRGLGVPGVRGGMGSLVWLMV